MKNVKVDGVSYRVRVVYGSLTRVFEINEGSNSGVSITGRNIRDIIGTSYSYSLDIEPDPRYPADYDMLYEVISSPVGSHIVTMPYGQTTITFEALIESGSDRLGANIGGYKRWNGLTIVFKAMEPYREA